MKTTYTRWIGLLVLFATVPGWSEWRGAADRELDASCRLEFECFSNGGLAMASNGPVQLGGTLGQLASGIMHSATSQIQCGFWKAESACELYHPLIIRMDQPGGAGISFMVVASNQYTVWRADEASGGLGAGPSAFTNVVVRLKGAGPAGSTTNIVDTTARVQDPLGFYIIQCE